VIRILYPRSFCGFEVVWAQCGNAERRRDAGLKGPQDFAKKLVWRTGTVYRSTCVRQQLTVFILAGNRHAPVR